MAENVEICIRGGGIVGYTLALLLARLNLKVGLVKESDNTKSSGQVEKKDIRAYALNQQSKALLESINAWPGSENVTPVHKMVVHADQNGLVQFDGYDSSNLKKASSPSPLSWIVDVHSLEEKLSDAIHQSKVVILNQSDEKQSQNFVSSNAPLTVICEGNKSVSKNQLNTQTIKTPYYQNAMAARVRVAEPNKGIAYQWFNSLAANSNNFEVLALLPLGGEKSKEFAIVWSAPERWISKLKAMPEAEFTDSLSQSTRGLFKDITLHSPRQSWPLTFSKTTHWSGALNPKQSWVLCGDSAHTVHPLAGMGLNLGLGDAASLYEFLLQRETKASWRPLNDLRLLESYSRHRKLSILGPTTFIDGIQRLFASDYSIASLIRNQGFNTFNNINPLKQWAMKEAMKSAT